ncbi:MAG: four-helix bundle copper-binding protein [Rhodospirillaceae bacterium]
MSFHPKAENGALASLIKCIDECHACVQACTSCADACLAEQDVERLRQCIRVDLDCADVCRTTAALASRRTGSNEDLLRAALEFCATACEICNEECKRHAEHHEHCRVCAEACRTCADACREAMDSLGGDGISGTGVQQELPWIRRH